MKNKDFIKLTEIEKKAILCAMIAKKTKGKLSKEQIKYIVDNIDLNLQYTIKVTSDAKVFAKEITLYQHWFSHSWAGSFGTIQEGTCILGNVEFGLDRYWEHSVNGRMTKPDIKNLEPNFDIEKISVVLITENDWNYYNNPSNEYDDWSYMLTFYIPESEPYKIDNNIKALIEAFDIEKDKQYDRT